MASGSFVSTGALPVAERVQALVDEAFERYRAVDAGANSLVYPALARVPDRFGICVAGVGGALFTAGDAAQVFPIMSGAKPFAFALVCEAIGPEAARRALGVDATGRAFNSISAIEEGEGGRTNPMVNPGAIATVGLVPGASAEDRWQALLGGLSRFAGRRLDLDEDVWRSASATNHRNRAAARLLYDLGALTRDPDETVALYTRACCVGVSAVDLAVMGATLADGGVNPMTGAQVVDPDVCRHVLSVMTTAGFYESSGDWLYRVGLPGKSGIGGGVMTVSPGKGGLGTFSPPLDAAGNSVRGGLVAEFLSRALGLDLFASQPEGGVRP